MVMTVPPAVPSLPPGRGELPGLYYHLRTMSRVRLLHQLVHWDILRLGTARNGLYEK